MAGHGAPSARRRLPSCGPALVGSAPHAVNWAECVARNIQHSCAARIAASIRSRTPCDVTRMGRITSSATRVDASTPTRPRWQSPIPRLGWSTIRQPMQHNTHYRTLKGKTNVEDESGRSDRPGGQGNLRSNARCHQGCNRLDRGGRPIPSLAFAESGGPISECDR